VVLAEEQTDKTRVLDYGAEEFLTKPISAESIIDKVNTLLLKETRGF
jgi:DNA-binding response OmpR family regulator